MPRREFHDLAEAALNHESGGQTCWGNLGLWQAGDSQYPQACAALADQLGQALRLAPDSRLLDVGFGCGDQILHWLQQYGVRELRGVNLSHSQTRLARQRVADAGYADVANQLQQGEAIEYLGRLQGPDASGWRPNTILALDCAYHFPFRQHFIEQASRLLPTGGRLGLSDLILARPDLTLAQRLKLRAVAHLSHLPWGNLQTQDRYRRTWTQAGFEIETWLDLTDHVLRPFGDWLRRYRATLAPDVARGIRWTKYRATAGFLDWAARHDVLRYVVCVGRRKD